MICSKDRNADVSSPKKDKKCPKTQFDAKLKKHFENIVGLCFKNSGLAS